ncbi:MAG: DUF2007 domain-containing protein [Dehalobacterium sp.]
MFCPKCKYEYEEGYSVCSTCGVDLVDSLPEEQSGPVEFEYVELVTVFETMDPGAIMIAKSLLEGSGIRYFAKNENLKNLFVLPVAVQIQVGRQDEQAAIDVLEDLINQ